MDNILADKLRIEIESIWELVGGRATSGFNEAGRLALIKNRAAEILAQLNNQEYEHDQ